MKKIAAGATATVFAVAGLSALTTAPASAAPFDNCTDARNAGYANIPSWSPYFQPGLDGSDNDGVGCEDGTGIYITPPAPVTPETPAVPEVGYLPENGPWAYDNCTEARAAGAVNIPAGTPGYGTHLDSDLDGIGCEMGVDIVDPVPADNVDSVPADGNMTWDGTQVEQMPAGGADTGVPVEASSMGTTQVGLSALALAAFAGSGLLLRRAMKV